MRLSSYRPYVILLLTSILIFSIGCRDDNDLSFSTDCDDIIDESPNLLREGLVAYYPLNNSIDDESGYGNVGTTSSIVPTTDRNMKCNGAYYFNGTDSGITISDNEQLSLGTSFTVSAWFNAETKKTQQIVGQKFFLDGRFRWPFALGLSASNDFVFSIATNEGNNTKQARKAGYLLDTWYMMTGVYEGSKVYLYINGVLESEREIEGEFFDSDLDLHIGRSSREDYDKFHGIIDDVRIYNRALSQEEILLLYDN